MDESAECHPLAEELHGVAEPIFVAERRGRIVVWRMNLPRKLNCLNATMLEHMRGAFALGADDPSVDAAVLTGTGRYFSSGAAFTDVGIISARTILRPAALHAAVAELNVGIFHPFIHFPKPIFIAANGPSVGGATTMQLLCDAVLCLPNATFHTPFRQLGITPEGCSTFTFERKMGAEGMRRMLVDGEKLNARVAASLGFVDVVVEQGGAEDLVSQACRFAQQWVSKGRGRHIVEEGLIEVLDATNQREALQLADAMFSLAFWKASGIPSLVAQLMLPPMRRLAKL
jgi:peroxisomal 3,2-trans-enoyl-CoA isomerase